MTRTLAWRDNVGKGFSRGDAEHAEGLADFDPFDAAYTALTAKLRPMVFELGFLPE